MRLALSILAVITAAGFADQLFVSQTETDETVVYRADDHVVALGTPAAGDRLLAEADSSGLNGFALVTVRNENGVSQASELGEVVYRNYRTLIVKLYRPLTGDFISPDVFSVSPLREDRSPSEPIDIPFGGEYDDTVADIVAAVSEDSLIATIPTTRATLPGIPTPKAMILPANGVTTGSSHTASTRK